MLKLTKEELEQLEMIMVNAIKRGQCPNRLEILILGLIESCKSKAISEMKMERLKKICIQE